MRPQPPRSGPELVTLGLLPRKPRVGSGSMSNSHLSLAPDCIDAALEAGCATLVRLQLHQSSAAGDPHGTRELSRQIRLVRHAIEELRALRADTANPLIHGFVLPQAPGKHLQPTARLVDPTEALAG